MTKSTVKQAASNVVADLTQAYTPEQIAAMIAAYAANGGAVTKVPSKADAKKAKAEKKAAPKEKRSYTNEEVLAFRESRKQRTELAQAEFNHRFATVTSGKKFLGETGEIEHVFL